MQQAARKPEPTRGITKPATDDTDSQADSTEVKFECPRPDGLFADPATCKKFILCGSGHPWYQNCPPGLFFDSKLKFCTFKTASLTCGPMGDEEEVKQDEATQEAQDNLPLCDKSCQLPDCFCSPDGTTIPGNLAPTQVPQMVLLTFSGAINELVVEHYKKILGYGNNGANKFSNMQQSRVNPNGCGIRSTFFITHDYTNYAQVHWLAAQGHEISLHSISHRLPELWWTEKANYSDWVEEMIGMREILLQLTNINGDAPVIKRDDIVGMRAPFIKPAGEPMYQMINDFGLQYDTSIVAPRVEFPLWPFTLDSKVPFDCASTTRTRNNKNNGAAESGSSDQSDGGQRQRRQAKLNEGDDEDEDSEWLSRQANTGGKRRLKRQTPFIGKSLKCPTKSYPGVWEVPINPMSNEFNTCHLLDQCVFPSQDDNTDSSEIVQFLIENFQRHYNTTRAPFQINIHVQWVLNPNRLRALTKFIDQVQKMYPDVWFVSFKQMIEWMRQPVSSNLASQVFKCEDPGKVKLTSCNRPQTCVVKLNTDADNYATTPEHAKKTDVRYLQICPGITCPKSFPWFGNLHGSERNLKTVLQLVQESLATTTAPNAADTQTNPPSPAGVGKLPK